MSAAPSRRTMSCSTWARSAGASRSKARRSSPLAARPQRHQHHQLEVGPARHGEGELLIREPPAARVGETALAAGAFGHVVVAPAAREQRAFAFELIDQR